jgi:hypothetical protein
LRRCGHAELSTGADRLISMMSSDTIIKIWGRESLKRAPVDQANILPVSPAERKFLVEVGLPDVEQLTFDLSAVTSLKGHEHLKRIGTDYEAPICIDDQQHGCIISFDEEGSIPVRFVNTGVRELATFLTIYKRDWLAQNFGGMPEHEAQRRVDAITKEFQSHDLTALFNPENWWSVILEQMRDGLL